MLSEEETNEILQRLKNHPGILEGVKDLLDVAEGVKKIKSADEAELELIADVRGLGRKALKDWAGYRVNEEKKEAQKQHLRQHSKKK